MIVFLLGLILHALILYLLHIRKRPRKVQHPPGPPGLPFIGNLHQLDTSAPHIYLWKLSKKYGPLMSMKLGSVPVLVVSSAKIAKEALRTHDLAFSGRPKRLGPYRLSYNGSDVGFAPYSESWRELRKICVLHLLSNKQVRSFRRIRENEVLQMIKNVSVRASSGQVVNLNETILSLTSTLICRIAFSKMHGAEESSFRRFDELMIESQAIQGGFCFSDYLPSFCWLDRLSGLIAKLDRVCKEFDEFFEDLIRDHLNPSRPKPENPDILDLLIQLKEEKSCSIDLTWNHVKAILMDVFIAGTDTSAVTLIWIMTALMKNPSIMKKLQKDIRDLIGEKGEVNEDDLPKLPYLKAVIKEAMRLYTPAPLLIRETTEKCTIGGYTIPPKTVVYINAWAIAKEPEYWDNPNEFVPERFLNTSVDIIGQDFQVIPFGSGRRGCPGMSMGLANVEITLANLLYSFDWELPSGVKKEDIDTEALPGLTMFKKNPLCLLPKKYKYS